MRAADDFDFIRARAEELARGRGQVRDDAPAAPTGAIAACVHCGRLPNAVFSLCTGACRADGASGASGSDWDYGCG